MELEEYEIMYRAEDHHWWYRGMTTVTRGVLDRHLGRGDGRRILDAGCGTGAVMSYLTEYGSVTGIDFAEAALHFAAKRGHVRLARASVTALPFADASFDLVTSFDVLCSVPAPGDREALGEFHRVLAPGGRLLLRLPAYDWLRGTHDVKVHIAQRYSRGALKRLLAEAGFTVELASYANCALFPVGALKRLSEKVLPSKQEGSDLTIGIGPLNGAFRCILAAEAPLVRTTRLPFGLTVLALARRV